MPASISSDTSQGDRCRKQQTTAGQNPGPFLRPALTIVSFKVAGLSDEKEQILADLCRKNKCDILCLQETHS